MDKSIESNPKWKRQQRLLKKQQFNFELMTSVDRQVRIEAAEKGETPSNIVRSVLGLEVNSPVRPRLGVSLADDEIKALAQRFKVDPTDKRSLLRRATEAIQLHYWDKTKKGDG